MGSVLLKPTLSKTLVGRPAAAAPAVASFLAGFLLVFYLGMNGGGHEAVVRGEVGIAAWWIVFLGAVVGVLPQSRLPRIAWIGVALLAAFGVWTALGLTWTESSEKTSTELARVAMHLGVFVLGLAVVRRETVKHLVIGLAGAIALLAWVALLSRLHPSWFPNDPTGDFLPTERARLTYPVNYWNGLAALIALAAPALLAVTAHVRNIVAQAFAAAALPGMALAAYLTLSRGGAIELATALAVYFALAPGRLRSLATLVPVAAGTLFLIIGVTQRDALQAVDGSALARSQGDELLAMTIAVCLGVGLIQVAITLTSRFAKLPPLPRLAPQQRRYVGAGAVIAVLLVAVAAGVPGSLDDRWHEFKDPSSLESNSSRFTTSGGEGRYQFWKAAVDANRTAPLTGIGPGTYEFWWAREGTLPGFVKHTHSLYFQTLAELGWIGLLLLVSFLGTVLYAGVRVTRRAKPERVPWLAAATAGCVVFCLSVAIDWTWELTVFPCAFLLLAAGILASDRGTHQRRRRSAAAPDTRPRTALVVLSVVAVGAAILPLLSASALRDSQTAAGAGRIDTALEDAGSASRAEPYAASPDIQTALLLEREGALAPALAAARKATDQEPTNWRNWVILSRLEARSGSAPGALAAYRKAKSLNPRSAIFKR